MLFQENEYSDEQSYIRKDLKAFLQIKI